MDTGLRPLSMGEVLDRTFQLYRAHFLMFAGISTFAAGLDLVWKLIQTSAVQMVAHRVAAVTLGFVNAGLSLINLVVYVIASAIAMAATNRAVSAIYLGQPTGIAQSYREVMPHWFRYVWLYVVAAFLAWGPVVVLFIVFVVGAVAIPRVAGSATGLIFMAVFGLSLFALVPFGIWMMLRYSLANASSVFEDLGISASLKRSVFLTRGAQQKVNIFVLLLLTGVISAVVTYACLTPVFIVVFRSMMNHTSPSLTLGMTIYSLLVGFVTTSVTIPIYAIGLTLFYYDARIRKEGFDVEWMMLRAAPPELPIAPPLPEAPPAESTLG